MSSLQDSEPRTAQRCGRRVALQYPHSHQHISSDTISINAISMNFAMSQFSLVMSKRLCTVTMTVSVTTWFTVDTVRSLQDVLSASRPLTMPLTLRLRTPHTTHS
jgi:hypothetical protein